MSPINSVSKYVDLDSHTEAFLKLNTRHVVSRKHFEIREPSAHPRLMEVRIKGSALRKFFTAVNGLDKPPLLDGIRDVPYLRFHAAGHLEEVLGKEFGARLREIIMDWQCGGFMLSPE